MGWFNQEKQKTELELDVIKLKSRVSELENRIELIDKRHIKAIKRYTTVIEKQEEEESDDEEEEDDDKPALKISKGGFLG